MELRYWNSRLDEIGGWNSDSIGFHAHKLAIQIPLRDPFGTDCMEVAQRALEKMCSVHNSAILQQCFVRWQLEHLGAYGYNSFRSV